MLDIKLNKDMSKDLHQTEASGRFLYAMVGLASFLFLSFVSLWP